MAAASWASAAACRCWCRRAGVGYYCYSRFTASAQPSHPTSDCFQTHEHWNSTGHRTLWPLAGRTATGQAVHRCPRLPPAKLNPPASLGCGASTAVLGGAVAAAGLACCAAAADAAACGAAAGAAAAGLAALAAGGATLASSFCDSAAAAKLGMGGCEAAALGLVTAAAAALASSFCDSAAATRLGMGG